MAELKYSARLYKIFLVRWVVGWVVRWVVGWLRKAENKAKAQQSWGLGFAELGKTQNWSEEVKRNQNKLEEFR